MNRFAANDGMNYELDTTIGACATPPGQSGLAVIRISGPAAFYAAKQLFKPLSERFEPIDKMAGYTCAPGYWMNEPELSGKAIRLDQVILTKYIGPHSFTGEDTLEIACHGGTAIKQAILDSVFRLGIRPAGPGEFTRRAFLNGKLDLAQAEAVMDLISSEAKLQAVAALNQLRGAVSEKVAKARGEIYDLLARTELILEYPEHEESPDNIDSLKQNIELVCNSIRSLSDTYRQGRLIREGLTVVIAGKPNAGKSSLMNMLAGYERAIVTEIPGTTRDTVTETIDIDGLPVHLVDTAGLRESSDPVEVMGVSRARQAMETSDLLIWLVSPPLVEHDPELESIREAVESDLPLLLVCGKDDLGESHQISSLLEEKFPELGVIAFSAITGEGLAKIRQAIHDKYESSGNVQSESVLLTNIRHREAALRAAEHLEQAVAALDSGLTLDLTAMLLRAGAESLAEITGDSVSEEVVQTIFSRFCIGK
jgi:tRNA modification GTPase